MNQVVVSSGRGWLLLTAWSTMATIWAAQLLVHGHSPQLRGGTPAGLFFGAAGTVLIVIAFLYTWRKSWLKFSLGSLRRWLEAHIYLGTLSLVFILAHSGFHFSAQVPSLAFLFLVLVVLSGIVGWVVLIYLPRLNAVLEDWPVEVEEICNRLTALHERIAELCSERPAPFLEIYNEVVIPLYREKGKQKNLLQDLSRFSPAVHEEYRPAFEELTRLLEEGLLRFQQLRLQLRFHTWLRSWLVVHIPLSICLAVFSLVHIFSVIWY